jgi:hypothetical protein
MQYASRSTYIIVANAATTAEPFLLFPSSAGSERPTAQSISMAGTIPDIYGPQMAGAFVQVASQFLGQSIIDSIRKQFPSRKVQRGDAYMDGGRHLLRMNIKLIHPVDKRLIQVAYEE